MKALNEYNADAIFISPVTGVKKKGDFSSEVILKCYNNLIKNKFYDPFGVLLGSFWTHSRYSGPREAVFTALCRKNYGCTHFIVGRDHTGVGNYYKNNASQDLFSKLDIGMTIISVDEVMYDEKKNVLIERSNIKENNNIKKISGSIIRELLLENNDLPAYLIKSEIAIILKEMLQNTPELLFEK